MQIYCVLKNDPAAEFQAALVTDPVSGNLVSLSEVLARIVPDTGTHLLQVKIEATILHQENSYAPITPADSAVISAVASLGKLLSEAES